MMVRTKHSVLSFSYYLHQYLRKNVHAWLTTKIEPSCCHRGLELLSQGIPHLSHDVDKYPMQTKAKKAS